MSWQCWTFRMIDTAFFRDGSPYNAGEGGYTVVCGNFPPEMTTLQGAIRTSLAWEQGWRPEQKQGWPGELGGPDDLGDLQLRGPYLLFNGKPLFPVPLLILKQKSQTQDSSGEGTGGFTRLIPGEVVECDLGKVRLPAPTASPAVARLPENLYLTRSGMQRVLEGGLPAPDDIREGKELWFAEPRTGLERADDTRTGREGMLYNCVHIRPARNVEIAVLIFGIPAGWKVMHRRVVNLGGEGRLAEVEVKSAVDVESFLPPPGVPAPAAGDKLRFTVTLVTPGWYEDPRRVIREGPPGVPGQCVAACVGKLKQVGGWDLAGREPRPLVPLLPAGSTWFFEAGAAEGKAIATLHGQCLGLKTAYGFGQILIGKWGKEING